MMKMTTTPLTEYEERHVYLCWFCQCMHVTTFVKTISVLTTIFSLISMALSIYDLTGDIDDTQRGAEISGIVVEMLMILTAILAFYTVVKRADPLLLVPHIVLQILSILGFIITTVAVGVIRSNENSSNNRKHDEKMIDQEQFNPRTMAVLFVVLFVGLTCFGVIIIVNFIRCFRYLKQIRDQVTSPTAHFKV